MNITFFGRIYWLLTANEYELCINFMNFIGLNVHVMGGNAYKESIHFSKRHDLFYGFADKKGKNAPISFFFQYQENWYSVHPTTRICSKCKTEFDAVVARSHDLYWGAANADEAFQWGLSLPYIDKCPHCGFDENGSGLKYLAIFHDGKVITALDN